MARTPSTTWPEQYLYADLGPSQRPAGEGETCQNNCAFKNVLGQWTVRSDTKDEILGSEEPQSEKQTDQRQEEFTTFLVVVRE